MPDTDAAQNEEGVDAPSAAFYRDVLETLNTARLPYVVGGAFALACYTGIRRHTKDLDLFIRRRDYARVARALEAAGHTVELAYPHWLAKVHHGDAFVDLIFNSGNGIAPVDDGWFEHAADAEVLGVPVRIAPAEESLWSKAFIMERERYDGADVAHLLRDVGPQFDWPRLLSRFGSHWRVLLGHLVLFGFVYPGERDRVPTWVLDDLLARLAREQRRAPPATRLCGGTLLSREQYLHDVQQQGYLDIRHTSCSTMQPQDVADWTDAIAASRE